MENDLMYCSTSEDTKKYRNLQVICSYKKLYLYKDQ